MLVSEALVSLLELLVPSAIMHAGHSALPQQVGDGEPWSWVWGTQSVTTCTCTRFTWFERWLSLRFAGFVGFTRILNAVA